MREESGLTFIKVPIMENIGGEMMEGSTFYFVAWIGWIVVTFYEKGLYSVEDKRLYIDFYYLFSVTCNDCFIYGISKCTFTFWYSFYRTHALFYLEKII